MTKKNNQIKQDKPSQGFTLTERNVRSRIVGVRSDIKVGSSGGIPLVDIIVDQYRNNHDSGTGDWD